MSDVQNDSHNDFSTAAEGFSAVCDSDGDHEHWKKHWVCVGGALCRVSA